jgi:2-polyprenyl-6-methoxyphenol hydroxylase-like FAD-dependent oxidoreductase
MLVAPVVVCSGRGAPMRRVGSHAIVIGASMAGLLAARAVAGPYERVTVLDRDPHLPTDAQARKGVPQGRHAHAILPGGAQRMDAMFPGLLDELEAAGAPVARNWSQAYMRLGGHEFSRDPYPIDPPVYSCTRPFLEGRVRARVQALPGVDVRAGTEVTDLSASADGSRVTGVRVECGGERRTLGADLVIDASGRSGRAPVWLEGLGYGPVPEESISVDVRYATRYIRLPPAALGLDTVFIGAAPELPRAVALMRMEGTDHWVYTLGGYTRAHHPPTDEAGFDAFAASAMPAFAMDAVRAAAEPLTPIVGHNFPTMLRRHYERMRRFPAGLLVFGDAYSSFNPLYGQGMTSATLQAEALRRCLLDERGDADLARRFFKAARKPVDVAWQMAGGADLNLPCVPGRRTPQVKLLNAYSDRLLAAAEREIRVGHTFWRVAGFLDPPPRLFAPDLLRAAFSR